jgi:hypothetical protein
MRLKPEAIVTNPANCSTYPICNFHNLLFSLTRLSRESGISLAI